MCSSYHHDPDKQNDEIEGNRDILVIENIKKRIDIYIQDKPVNFHQDCFDHCLCSQFHHHPDNQNEIIGKIEQKKNKNKYENGRFLS